MLCCSSGCFLLQNLPVIWQFSILSTYLLGVSCLEPLTSPWYNLLCPLPRYGDSQLLSSGFGPWYHHVSASPLYAALCVLTSCASFWYLHLGLDHFHRKISFRWGHPYNPWLLAPSHLTDQDLFLDSIISSNSTSLVLSSSAVSIVSHWTHF